MKEKQEREKEKRSGYNKEKGVENETKPSDKNEGEDESNVENLEKGKSVGEQKRKEGWVGHVEKGEVELEGHKEQGGDGAATRSGKRDGTNDQT